VDLPDVVAAKRAAIARAPALRALCEAGPAYHLVTGDVRNVEEVRFMYRFMCCFVRRFVPASCLAPAPLPQTAARQHAGVSTG
jgi:hypothetical protein